MKTTKGIYIHIPFCLSKCTYCDFYSVSIDTEMMEFYVNALVDEIKKSSTKHTFDVIDTVYIGGGTPSVLPLYLLEKIVNSLYDNFKLDLREFTIEVNPSTNVDFASYKDFGIDRISLGIQSLNDKLLHIIGRAHDSRLALDTISNANKYFDKISCDLMLGLPNQSIGDVESSVSILSLLVNHISMYMLKLSDTVKMYRQVKNAELVLPDDDIVVDMYERAHCIMKCNGFSRYEISNFSTPNYESLHNLKYWNRDEYIGLGAAAHGFVNNRRYFNPSNIKEYVTGNNYGNDKVEFEYIDTENAIFEKIMLALRLRKGINIKEINDEFNIDFKKRYAIQLANLANFLDINGDNIAIKKERFLLQSAIAREFII